MSAHLSFLVALERLPRVGSRVMAAALGRCRPAFLQRRWITEEDYLTHVMVPFLDSEQEVEVEIDQDAAVYRYRSPQQRSRTVERPLANIALYALQVDAWVTDLASLVGIEERNVPTANIACLAICGTSGKRESRAHTTSPRCSLPERGSVRLRPR